MDILQCNKKETQYLKFINLSFSDSEGPSHTELTSMDMKYIFSAPAMFATELDSDSNSNVDVQFFKSSKVPAFISQNGKFIIYISTILQKPFQNFT